MSANVELLISKARYAQKSVAVSCSSKDGLKTRAARITEACGGRWSGREKAYILPESRAVTVQALFDAGWDATVLDRLLFMDDSDELYTYIEAKARLA